MLPATASRCAVVPRALALLWLSFAMRRTAADGWRAEGQSGLDSAPLKLRAGGRARRRSTSSFARLDCQGVAAVGFSFSRRRTAAESEVRGSAGVVSSSVRSHSRRRRRLPSQLRFQLSEGQELSAESPQDATDVHAVKQGNVVTRSPPRQSYSSLRPVLRRWTTSPGTRCLLSQVRRGRRLRVAGERRLRGDVFLGRRNRECRGGSAPS